MAQRVEPDRGPGDVRGVGPAVPDDPGTAAYNDQLLRQLEDPPSAAPATWSPDFWNRTLQNWQSDLLAVAAMAVLCIYLRQRGSPECKPVGAAHTAKGIEG